MSRALKLSKLGFLKCNASLALRVSSRNVSDFSTSSLRWNIATSFFAGCTATGFGGYIWWKTRSRIAEEKVYQSKEVPHASPSNSNLSLCSSVLDSPIEQEEISSSPWLESRDPILSREALKKQINEKITQAKRQASDICMRMKDESGSPGFVMAVSVDGKIIHEAGFGYADVENRVYAVPDTVMRIASISKSFTTAAAAKLIEKGKLDLDKPVQYYVPQWPEKYVNGEKVTITTRQLVSHISGVRGYDKSCTLHKKKVISKDAKNDKEKKIEKEKNTRGLEEEYYLKDNFKTVNDGLKLFQDDKLCSIPGTEYLYSTHAYTLISAVIESAAGKPYTDVMKELWKELGLENTYLDENDPIIYKRARFYNRNKAGRLVNVPYVDCSYKWGGGGLLSNVRDLTRFGNAMLYSYQSDAWDSTATRKQGASSNSGVSANVVKLSNTIDEAKMDTSSSNSVPKEKDEFYKIAPNDSASGKETTTLKRYVRPEQEFLKSNTVKEMWTPVKGTKHYDPKADGGGYGMGWTVVPYKPKAGTVNDQRFYASHTGAAVGSSSVLLIMPTNLEHIRSCNQKLDVQQPVVIQTQGPHPRGVVVALMCNMQMVGLNSTAKEIANIFADLDKSLRELDENQKNKGSIKIDKGLERC